MLVSQIERPDREETELHTNLLLSLPEDFPDRSTTCNWIFVEALPGNYKKGNYKKVSANSKDVART